MFPFLFVIIAMNTAYFITFAPPCLLSLLQTPPYALPLPLAKARSSSGHTLKGSMLVPKDTITSSAS